MLVNTSRADFVEINGPCDRKKIGEVNVAGTILKENRISKMNVTDWLKNTINQNSATVLIDAINGKIGATGRIAFIFWIP